MNEFDLLDIEFKREMLREALNKCKPANIAIFNKIYGSVETIEGNKMGYAYTQVQTFRKILRIVESSFFLKC